jgi:hydrogenase maturation protease
VSGIDQKRRVLVVAVGSADRGDDGIGRRVGERIANRLPAGATLIDCGADPLALLAPCEGCDLLLAVDAAALRGTPGRIHRIDLSRHDLPYELLASSSHDVGLAGAVALARELGLLPPVVIVYAVEGVCFEQGAPMSPAVAAAAEDVASCMLEEIRRELSSAAPARHVGAVRPALRERGAAR